MWKYIIPGIISGCLAGYVASSTTTVETHVDYKEKYLNAEKRVNNCILFIKDQDQYIKDQDARIWVLENANNEMLEKDCK